MLTATDFLTSWSACNEDANFVRYCPASLTPFNVSTEDVEFLANVGLPNWAAPHMWFFSKEGDALPPPCDPFGNPLEIDSDRFGMIGSTGENWPICLDPTRPGEIICLRLEPGYPRQLLNMSFLKLAECLLAYCQTVDEALAFGKMHGDDDAWRNRRYPLELDAKLCERIRLIDPDAFASDAYWTLHFQQWGRSESLPKK